MRPVLVPLALVCALAAACAAPPAADTAQALSDLRAADAAYHEAVNSMDWATWRTFYAPGALIYPPNHAPVTTDAELTAFIEEVGGMPGFSVDVTTSVFEVGAGADVGYTVGHATMSMTGPDGAPMTDSGPDVHVWRKQVDGSWKIAVDIWNSDVPLPMPEAAGSGS